ncbi:MAG: HEAT repeat domain-containing protein [Planctomycetota bacterium]
MTTRLLLASLLLLAACGGPAIDESKKNELKARWQLFLADSPDWPEARAWWLQQEPAAVDLLTLNLLQAMVSDHVQYRKEMGARAGLVDFSDQAPDPDRLWRRAQAEMVDLPELSLGVLIETLRRSDADVKDLMTSTFARIGRPALPRLEQVLKDESEQQPRIVATHAIGRIGAEDPEATPEAQRILISLLKSDDDWAVRGEAARALGSFTSTTAVSALASALTSDTDPFVQTKAAESLGQIGGEPAERALVAALPVIQRANDLDLLRAVGRELRRLSGKRLPNDPRMWQQYLTERYGSPR